jgi:hypothetical protein
MKKKEEEATLKAKKKTPFLNQPFFFPNLNDFFFFNSKKKIEKLK